MYDYIVCGSGSAGSAVAGRLAEDPGVSVLLIEAGGPDDAPAVQDPNLWPLNFGSDRLWDFTTVPEEALGGRALGYAMGRVLGGGGSVNVSNWVRGHRDDWDHYAAVSGDPAWSHRAVSDLFDRVESAPPRPGQSGTNAPFADSGLDCLQTTRAEGRGT